ncbi:NAD(P)-binding protein [Hypoxylon sp. EC38]|nr:NAD(P)-binding protein [Hypoxylon sp. EC38]
MTTYLVTGASAGLGLAFLREISQDPTSTVIGMVRDKAKAEKTLSELELSKIKLVQGDLSDYDSLTKVVQEVSGITGGCLDYLIANAAAHQQIESAMTSMDKLAGRPEILEKELVDTFKVNVVGNIHLFNLFLPLIRRSSVKKVVAITTGMADLDFLAKYDTGLAGPYAISKGALNVAVAKFAAQHRDERILFMAISPGVVDTHPLPSLSEEEQESLKRMVAGVMAYAPQFKGPSSPNEAARSVLSVLHNASFEAGDSGTFVSHLGTKQWV